MQEQEAGKMQEESLERERKTAERGRQAEAVKPVLLAYLGRIRARCIADIEDGRDVEAACHMLAMTKRLAGEVDSDITSGRIAEDAIRKEEARRDV